MLVSGRKKKGICVWQRKIPRVILYKRDEGVST